MFMNFTKTNRVMKEKQKDDCVYQIYFMIGKKTHVEEVHGCDLKQALENFRTLHQGEEYRIYHHQRLSYPG